MFVDEVELTLKGGHGGAGRVSFAPGFKSGPDGGNGGRGGDLYGIVTSDLSVLNRYSRQKDFSGENGEVGDKNKKSGKNGGDLEIYFPIGTSLIDKKTGEEIELNKRDQKVLICKGGLGGRGNFEFRSSRRTTPEYAQPGLEGEIREFDVILKLIADFGLIGLPNAGKSSLLNELTAANVKVASYPFTTLEPNLGVSGDNIIADIPGLIEGASEGKGLGVKFLRHIEKVKVLLHCISAESEDPKKDYQVVRKELGEFNPELLKKDEIILLTKADTKDPKEMEKIIKTLKTLKRKIIPVSIYDLESLENLGELL